MKTATDDLIALVCKSVAEEHMGDCIVPGVVIAHLRPEKSPTGAATFYVAARRYDSDLSPEQRLLGKVYNDDLDEAVRELAELVCNPHTKHQRELASIIVREEGSK
jgi:hypothetical protein